MFTKVSVGINTDMIKAYTCMFTENYRYFFKICAPWAEIQLYHMQVLLTSHHISLYSILEWNEYKLIPVHYKKLLQLLLTNDFSNEKTIYSKTIYERQTSQQSSKAGWSGVMWFKLLSMSRQEIAHQSVFKWILNRWNTIT